MAIVTYDTSVLIAYQPTKFPAGYRFSSVVIQEMTAGAGDISEVRAWQTTLYAAEKAGKLLVPNAEDWWLAGKVLYSLLHGLKSKAGGLTPRLPAEEKQRLIRDVLIARTTKRAGALLVTNNLKDFTLIKRFCAVRVSSGASYF